MSAAASATARKREPNRASRQNNEPPAWMSWLRDGFVRTPNSFFPLAAVIDGYGGSAVGTLSYVHAKTAGGIEREDGTWAYPEWIQLRLDELAAWLECCTNTAWRAIHRCAKLGVIETRKRGRFLEVRTRVESWGKAAKARVEQIRKERLEKERLGKEAAAPKRATTEGESAETDDDDGMEATVISSSSGSSSALRVLPAKGESSCPASSYCCHRDAAIEEAKKGRKLFAICSPSSVENKEVTKSIIYNGVDDQVATQAAGVTHLASEEGAKSSILPDIARMLDEWRVGRLSPPPPHILKQLDGLLAGLATAEDLRQRLDENSDLFLPGRGKWGGVRWVAEELANDVRNRPAAIAQSPNLPPALSSEEPTLNADTFAAHEAYEDAKVRQEWDSLSSDNRRNRIADAGKQLVSIMAGFASFPPEQRKERSLIHAIGQLRVEMRAAGRLVTLEQYAKEGLARHA